MSQTDQDQIDHAIGQSMRRTLAMSPEERRETLDQLYFAGGKNFVGYGRRFLILLGLAIVIASCGLHADSTAVVIGAMLIAPLMDPVLGLSAAMILGWTGRVLRSIILIALGTVVSILIAIMIGLVIPDRIVVVPEIAARTSPILLDLGVALGAGAAAAYALTRRRRRLALRVLLPASGPPLRAAARVRPPRQLPEERPKRLRPFPYQPSRYLICCLIGSSRRWCDAGSLISASRQHNQQRVNSFSSRGGGCHDTVTTLFR